MDGQYTTGQICTGSHDTGGGNYSMACSRSGRSVMLIHANETQNAKSAFTWAQTASKAMYAAVRFIILGSDNFSQTQP